MIRSGNSARFTPTEVEEFRQIGLDLGDVRHQNDIEQEVSRWAHTLADERFDLLEKIAVGDGESEGSETASQAQRRAFCRFVSVISIHRSAMRSR